MGYKNSAKEVAVPFGCTLAHYGIDPENSARNVIVGCMCDPRLEKKCSSYFPVIPWVNMYAPSTDGYADASRRCVTNSKNNRDIFYRSFNLVRKRGYMGIVDGTNFRDVHMLFGMAHYVTKYKTNAASSSVVGDGIGDESCHFWLEDVDGKVYDHIDPVLFQIGSSVGADVSRISPFQRFVGVSKKSLFENFGVWYSPVETIFN